MTTEGYVVWNGTLERQAIEAERIYASPNARAEVQLIDLVRDWLARNGEATANTIAADLSEDPNAVNGALYNLRHKGLVEVSTRTTRTAYGRTAHFYRLTGRA
jgi:predicted ArsR family transcriptional regulator